MQSTVGTVTVAQISTPGAPGFKNPNDVQFKVEYAKDFNGEKTLPEGETITASKESAEHFASLGMGSIVTETEAAAQISTPGAEQAITEESAEGGGKKGKGKGK